MFWSKHDVPEAPKPEIDTDYDNPFDEIMDKLDSLASSISTLSSKLRQLETKIESMEGPAQKLSIELADAKSQLRKNTDFTQALVMELIGKQRVEQTSPVNAPKEPSDALKNYLARKANGSDVKPKLP